jgi:hypothetical protein
VRDRNAQLARVADASGVEDDGVGVHAFDQLYRVVWLGALVDGLYVREGGEEADECLARVLLAADDK